MYVDENVLNFMNHQEFENTLIRNETIEATVVFIDICGFTSISEKQPPDEVVSLLNKIFDVMVKEILAQGGRVDKFIGDAVMAVFLGNFHLDRALDACIAVRAKIAKMEGFPTGYVARVSTGLNSGEMVCGNIGSVSLRRLDYTVIGDSVNIAQRLQAAAAYNQILISDAAYQNVKESFNCKPVGEIQLKNKSIPVMVYEVLD
jgi:class 3 adenylate cyclase